MSDEVSTEASDPKPDAAKQNPEAQPTPSSTPAPTPKIDVDKLVTEVSGKVSQD